MCRWNFFFTPYQKRPMPTPSTTTPTRPTRKRPPVAFITSDVRLCDLLALDEFAPRTIFKAVQASHR